MRFALLPLLLAVILVGLSHQLRAQGTAFSYQGQLNDGGTAASGSYDFQFSLFNAPTNGGLISGPVTNLDVPVLGGIFKTNLDFGNVFSGTNYWLAIGVRTNGNTNAFTVLQPLQALLPVPYAIFAESASNLNGTLPASKLSGTYSQPVNFSSGANNFSGSFNGNGAGLTTLNGSQITSGTVADARLTANVALLATNQTFTGSNFFSGVNTFTNRANTFIGNFFGNGLVGWLTVSATATQAMPNAGYLLLNPNLTTVTLPPTSALLVGDIVKISGSGGQGFVVAQNAGQSIVGNFSGYSHIAWLPSNAGSGSWFGMASSASGGLMAAAQSSISNIKISRDYGYSWSNSGSPSSTWHCVACSADGSRLIAGQATSGSLFYSTNFGTSWAAGSVSGVSWSSVAMSANGLNAVATGSSGVYTSANGGLTWGPQLTGISSWTGAACSADGSKMVVVASAGPVYTSADGGNSWTGRTVGNGSLDLTSVASSSDGTKLVAVVYNGGIYSSLNSGVSWQQTTATAAGYEGVVSSADGQKLAAVGSGGTIYTSINYGSTWTPTSAMNANWSAICGSADGSHLAASVFNGNIYYSSASSLVSTTVGTVGYLAGPQFSAVELQYLGNGQFMPISSTGALWGN